MKYIYCKKDASEQTTVFTQKAAAYFAPKPRSTAVDQAFLKIVQTIDSSHASEPVPFVYLSGKSRKWLQLGEELATEGCLDQVHEMLESYLRFLHGTNRSYYFHTVTKLQQLDKCWSKVKGWHTIARKKPEDQMKKKDPRLLCNKVQLGAFTQS